MRSISTIRDRNGIDKTVFLASKYIYNPSITIYQPNVSDFIHLINYVCFCQCCGRRFFVFHAFSIFAKWNGYSAHYSLKIILTKGRNNEWIKSKVFSLNLPVANAHFNFMMKCVFNLFFFCSFFAPRQGLQICSNNREQWQCNRCFATKREWKQNSKVKKKKREKISQIVGKCRTRKYHPNTISYGLIVIYEVNQSNLLLLLNVPWFQLHEFRHSLPNGYVCLCGPFFRIWFIDVNTQNISYTNIHKETLKMVHLLVDAVRFFLFVVFHESNAIVGNEMHSINSNRIWRFIFLFC